VTRAWINRSKSADDARPVRRLSSFPSGGPAAADDASVWIAGEEAGDLNALKCISAKRDEALPCAAPRRHAIDRW